MALATFHTDDFERVSADLDGDTMSDSLGTWKTCHAGTIGISSGDVQQVAGADNHHLAIDDAMTNIDIQRAIITLAAGFAFAGAIARQDVAADLTGSLADHYLAWTTTTKQTLYRCTGHAGFTSLGTYNSSPIAGDTMEVDCNGSAISFLVNGSVVIGPITDANYATGVGGLRVFDDAVAAISDWEVQTDQEVEAGSSPARRRLSLLGKTLMRRTYA